MLLFKHFPSYLPLPLDWAYEDRVDTYIYLHRDGAYYFRVYASGLGHKCHPALFVLQYLIGD